ncbi:MAG: hypothetical protein ACRDIC_13680 [bacterium]
MPNEWNLIIGDALFNFRASLDYLAWQLFQRGTEAHTHKPELVSWPIIGKQTDATSAFKGRLPGLLPHHQTLAEACQPYTGEPGKLHPLTILNDLSRQDKHRQIVMVLAAHKEYTIRGSLRHFRCERSVLPSSEKPVPLKPGTELVTWYGKRTDDHEPEMDVHFEGTTGIAFENGLWVLEVLARIEERIGNILANFEPLM